MKIFGLLFVLSALHRSGTAECIVYDVNNNVDLTTNTPDGPFMAFSKNAAVNTDLPNTLKLTGLEPKLALSGGNLPFCNPEYYIVNFDKDTGIVSFQVNDDFKKIDDDNVNNILFNTLNCVFNIDYNVGCNGVTSTALEFDVTDYNTHTPTFAQTGNYDITVSLEQLYNGQWP